MPDNEAQVRSGFILAICMGLCVLVVLFCGKVHAYTDQEAILSIIGEAESEPYLGKVAIAASIVNRGHLRGVYGLKSVRVLQHKYSQDVYDEAKLAWEYVKKNGVGNWQATGWGNAGDIAQFKRKGWFKNCEVVAHVGSHWFYKEVKRG